MRAISATNKTVVNAGAHPPPPCCNRRETYSVFNPFRPHIGLSANQIDDWPTYFVGGSVERVQERRHSFIRPYRWTCVPGHPHGFNYAVVLVLPGEEKE